MAIETKTLGIGGRDARVHLAGTEGPTLLLLHGGWAGAEAHWGPVWERLARHHRIVAPELPGITRGSGAAFERIADYADWVSAVLDALGIARCRVAGNSLGAAIAWCIAARDPGRLEAIVLVDGRGFPRRGAVGRAWLALPPVRATLRWMVRSNTYSRATLDRAFARPGDAPAQVVETVTQADPPQLDDMFRLYVNGDDSPPPRVPVLIVWGECDRLIGIDVAAARRLHRSLPGSHLAIVPDAGHLPQVEQPRAFVDAVEAFLGGLPPAPSAAARA